MNLQESQTPYAKLMKLEMNLAVDKNPRGGLQIDCFMIRIENRLHTKIYHIPKINN